MINRLDISHRPLDRFVCIRWLIGRRSGALPRREWPSNHELRLYLKSLVIVSIDVGSRDLLPED